ncbi:hypothetical protein SAMN05192534_1186 [Alteribacillus persepolensis]|uniref:Uncharacterized protein n=1 Tax=Alteribacillus persepolensis TaxID=568899 RepID=A0A1G8H1E4_9BACI|nr:hypothetical protein SAMN05192534_1186 [Alteribacillus persepolensis]
MDGLAYLSMQILTVLYAVGTIVFSVIIGKIWRKQKGY